MPIRPLVQKSRPSLVTAATRTVAGVLAGAATVAVLGACSTKSPGPAPTSSTATTATTTKPEAAPGHLTVPTSLPGELGRSIFTSDSGTVTKTTPGRTPKANADYSVEGACVATGAGSHSVAYRVTDSQDATKVIAGGTITCHGDGLTINGAFTGSPSSRPVSVTLDDTLTNITAAYVVLIPTP